MSEQSSHRREYVVNVVWFDVCSWLCLQTQSYGGQLFTQI